MPKKNIGFECVCPESTFNNPGYYNDPVDVSEALCLPCDYTCKACVGPTAGDCKSCEKDHHRHLVDGKCVPEAGFEDIGKPETVEVCKENEYRSRKSKLC